MQNLLSTDIHMKFRYIFLLFSALIACNTLYAQKSDQKITISGIVLDVDNNPVGNVEIFTDNESTGKFSDNHGRFKVRVKADAVKISAFSESQGFCEAEINGQSEISLNLSKTTEAPTDFINKNSGENKEGQARGKKMNTYTDIYQMIRHEVPGVLVSGRSIVVQGPNSFFGSSQPLFVVNGVRVNNIDNINPVEVKSIKLLKGSGANIYGNEGANGVIVIELQGTKDNNLKK